MIFMRALAVLSAWPSLYWTPVDAGSIASWTTGQGAPQIILQDDDTGDVLYSICNSNDTAVFPANESRSLVFDHGLAPKQGSSLTGIGYVDDHGIIMAGMWYLNYDNQIVHSLWKCNETGHFVKALDKNQWTISVNDKSISPNTGLAAVNLGRNGGYRVYYQQLDMVTSAYMFTNDGGWRWYGYISQDPLNEPPIAAAFTDPSAIIVVFPRDVENIEVAMLKANETWTIRGFPFSILAKDPKLTSNETDLLVPTNGTDGAWFNAYNQPNIVPLEAWDGHTKGLGLTLDSDGTRRVFYIGTDAMLHCVLDNNVRSEPCTDTIANKWPAADSPNAPFATAFDASRDEIWIFYMSGGNLTQIHRSSKDKWENPIALPSSVSPPPAEHGRQVDGRGGLSKAALGGLGAGVGVASLLMAGLAAYICIQRKRGKEEKKKADADAEVVAAANQAPDSHRSPTLVYTSGVPSGQWTEDKWVSSPDPGGKTGSWQDRSAYQQVPNSPPLSDVMNQNHIHEMAHEVRYHEMPADNMGDRGTAET